MKVIKCRHNKSWLVAGGHIEWCYQCGAIRIMRNHYKINGVTPASNWAKPTGLNGDNPYEKWKMINDEEL